MCFIACCMLYSASAFACAKSMASGMQKQMLLLIGILEENCGYFQDFQILQNKNIGSARFCRLAGDVHSRCIRFNIHDLHLPHILFGKARNSSCYKSVWHPAYQSLLPIPWSLHGSMMPGDAHGKRGKQNFVGNRDRWTRKSLNQHLLIPLYIFWYFLITSKVTGLWRSFQAVVLS